MFHPSHSHPSQIALLRRATLGRLIVAGLVTLAILSAGVGVADAVHRSQDFQWSGERLFVHHVDPWAEYLRGDPDGRFIKTQIPNYLAILYILIVPLGWLPMIAANVLWALCNTGFAVTSALLTGRFFGFRGRELLAIVSLLLIATPTRISIGNGQQSLLVLFVWSAAVLTNRLSGIRAGLSGISYFKFSFAPAFFVYLFGTAGWRRALASLAAPVVAVLIAWLWITGGHDLHAILRIGLEPFAVARDGYKDRMSDANLMSMLDGLLERLHFSAATGTTAGLAAALAVCLSLSALTFRRSADADATHTIALMATMNFVLFMHHSYDAVVLLFPLCYALRWRADLRAKWILGLLAFLLYAQRVWDTVAVLRAWSVFLDFGLLCAVLGLLCSLGFDRGGSHSSADGLSGSVGERLASAL
jgi:hypothetical protein